MSNVFKLILIVLKAILLLYVVIFVLVLFLDICKAVYVKINSKSSFSRSFKQELTKDLHITFVKTLNPVRFILWAFSLV